MFFLLLFFLIVSTMITPAAIKVLLPKSETAEPIAVKESKIVLAVDSLHNYFIDGAPIPLAEIEPALKLKIEQPLLPDTLQNYTVELQADKSIEIQELVSLIDIGNRLDIHMFLSVEKEK
jgi:biopolymer transport protein ExbD